MRTRLVLIRHGEDQGLVDRVVAGHRGCRGLSASGHEQVAKLANRLESSGELSDATALYSSVLPRAVQTAEAIRPMVGDGSLDIVQDCDLCELHEGDVDGLDVDTARRDHWDAATERGAFPYEPRAPGAESYAQFLVRAGGRLVSLARHHAGETIVVVCHAGVIRGAVTAFGNMPFTGGFFLAAANTSLTEFVFDPGTYGPRFQWALIRFNDDSHLR